MKRLHARLITSIGQVRLLPLRLTPLHPATKTDRLDRFLLLGGTIPMFDSRQSAIIPTYKPLLDNCIVTKPKEAQAIADRIRANIDRYNELERRTGIPALFIAALHNMECGGDFNQHLANGDPIHSPTVNEPAGIPAGTWEYTAEAILRIKLKEWDCDPSEFEDKWCWLYYAERWNGFGYRMYHPEVPSPYLWSATSSAKKGKYVADGKWDADAVSQQIGVVAIFKTLGI